MPIAKVFTMCFSWPPSTSTYCLLNGLVFSLLLPCLIFSQLGQAVTLHKMLQWWFIPVNVILGTISGSLIVATIIRLARLTLISSSQSHKSELVVLLAALCRDTNNPFGDSEKCTIDGTAYISFGQWVVHLFLNCQTLKQFFKASLIKIIPSICSKRREHILQTSEDVAR